jgi:hypothetical protein
MKFTFLQIALLATLAFPVAAQAQGTVRGAQEGAAMGTRIPPIVPVIAPTAPPTTSHRTGVSVDVDDEAARIRVARRSLT